MSTANTNQKEHTMPDFEHLVKCPNPSHPIKQQKYHLVPRSKSTIHEFVSGWLYIGDDVMRRVCAGIDTPPEELEQQASDALLLAEHLRERQSAVQAEKEAEKDAQALEKEARTLYESVYGIGEWHYIPSTDKDTYRTMARKAREIHGVSK